MLRRLRNQRFIMKQLPHYQHSKSPILPAVFPSFTWKRGWYGDRWGIYKCKLGVISQERLKSLLSTDSKSYMPRRLTLSDLEWSFHASRAISAIAELVVIIPGSGCPRRE